jgi:hypothetical protein
MKQIRFLFIFLICSCLIAEGQGNSFNKVRYNGGTLQTSVDPEDWNNTLTVTSDLITFTLKDGQVLLIKPSQITGLGYGQEAHRRVGTMIALGILVAPVALFGLLHKTRKHFVSIEFDTPDGKKSALLLQAHKDNYRAMLVALKGVTGVPISVSEDEAKYVPTGVATNTVKEPEKEEKETKAEEPSEEKTICKLTSVPDGADIYADDAFVGNTPAQLKLSSGKHHIRVVMKRYEEWSRNIDVPAGSEITLNAVLIKGNN